MIDDSFFVSQHEENLNFLTKKEFTNHVLPWNWKNKYKYKSENKIIVLVRENKVLKSRNSGVALMHIYRRNTEL